MSEDINNNDDEKLEEEMDEGIISLNNENGEEEKFEFLDLIDLDGEQYVVLLPISNEEDSEEAGEVVILKVEDTDSEDEESYVSVENEDILNKVFKIFKDKFKDEFDFVD